MPEVSRTYYTAKDAKAELHEIKDGIYRISGFVNEYGITLVLSSLRLLPKTQLACIYSED